MTDELWDDLVAEAAQLDCTIGTEVDDEDVHEEEGEGTKEDDEDVHEEEDADEDDDLPATWDEDYDDVEPTGCNDEDFLHAEDFHDYGFDEDEAEDRKKAFRGHRNTEVCLLCRWPLNLRWAWSDCEFGEPAGSCACNGCRRQPIRNRGHQPQYCTQKCADRMKFALRRAKRRAAGATSRSLRTSAATDAYAL